MARPHRPALFADLTALIDAAGGIEPGSRAELAAATAAVVVGVGRDESVDVRPSAAGEGITGATAGPGAGSGGAAGPGGAGAAGREGVGAAHDERFVGLADRVGLDTLAALWRGSDPVSLPGALWTLYLLREWCRTRGAEVTRFWRAGEPLAPAEAAVAGVADFADVSEVQASVDAVLTGVYAGDLAVALERAAAFFRVVAAGRLALGDGDAPTMAARNERAAEALGAAARKWRQGVLR